MITFCYFYRAYPRHIGKRDAEKAWNAAMKRGVEPEAIMLLLSQRLETEWRKRELKYIPYPASFLRGEAFDVEVEAQQDDKEPTLFRRQPHWCPMCEYPHSWDCGDHPACCLSYEVCCPEWHARIEAKRGRRDELGSTGK